MSGKIESFDYPKWKYHASKKPLLVHSSEEEKLLGSGWENSPAYFSDNKKTISIKSEEVEAFLEKKSLKQKIKELFKWQQQGT
jgi:hypothetical protein